MSTVRAVAVLSVVAICGCAGKGQGGAPANGEPAPASAPAPRQSAEDARREDEAAYRFLYLPEQKRLATDRRGEWVAIVAGRVVTATGARIEPVKTMEAADAAARAAAPGATHRFVFQIGEEGDVELILGGCELAHVLGTPFVGLLQKSGAKADSLGPGEPISAKFGDALREITVKGPDDRMFVRPEVGRPGADGAATEIYCIGTGFAGHGTMSAATASAAGLDLWEIPGVANVKGGLQSGACRRARARFRWTGSNLDFTVPVAIWPK